jgi:MFS family permease
MDDDQAALVVGGPQSETISRTLVLCASMAAVGGLLFGYDTGVIAGALLAFDGEFALNTAEQSLVVSITLVGALVGSLAGGPMANRHGRKPVIWLASVIFIAGALMLAAAPTKSMLVVGRAVVGVAVGLSSQAVPMFIAELTPPAERGRVVTCFQMAITLGILAAAVVDYILIESKNWRLMFGLGAVPGVLQFCGLFYIPESPR